MTFESLVEDYTKKRASFFFLQVGGYDGVTFDPIRRFITKYKWKGIIVEPNPIPFGKLEDLYKDSESILCLNTAIAPKCGTMPFFFVPPSSTDVEWAPTIGTLVPERGRINEFASVTRCIQVSCMPLDHIVCEHGLTSLDLLQIDTEGYDFEVIRTLDLKTLKPRIIHWEDRHLPPKEQDACIDYLKNYGYNVFRERHPNDSTAYLPEIVT